MASRFPEDMATVSAHPETTPATKLCGISLETCCKGQGSQRFTVLTVCAIASAIGFAYLQEVAIREEGFKYYGYMTLLTSLTYMACGQVERIITRDTQRVGQLKQYLLLSVLTFSGMAFTNASLQYINYPTRVLFKSSKLLPTMIVGTLMQGRFYSGLEYTAALTLVAGIVLFTLGDAATRPSFEIWGVILILVGVFADAATSNYEEKSFFRIGKPASQAEVITYASLFGSTWAALVMKLTPKLFFPDESVSAGFVNSSWETTIGLVGASVCGYLSVQFVLLLIRLCAQSIPTTRLTQLPSHQARARRLPNHRPVCGLPARTKTVSHPSCHPAPSPRVQP